MNNPENLYYSEEHEWAHFIDENEVIIGITDYAQTQLGDIIYLEFPKVGETFKVGDGFGEIEAVKTVSDLFLPMSGKIIEFNESLNDNPEKVNDSPYDEGWIIKVEITNPAELDELLDSKTYSEIT